MWENQATCVGVKILPLLPLSLMFSLPHKFFFLVWGKNHHKPIFSTKWSSCWRYFALWDFKQSCVGGGVWDCIGCVVYFQKALPRVTVWLCLYSHKPFCTARALLPGCSPLPTEGQGRVGWSVLGYLSPLLPIFTFPDYQQRCFLSLAALFRVFFCGTHPLISLFSSLTACKVLKLQAGVNFVSSECF